MKVILNKNKKGREKNEFIYLNMFVLNNNCLGGYG